MFDAYLTTETRDNGETTIYFEHGKYDADGFCAKAPRTPRIAVVDFCPVDDQYNVYNHDTGEDTIVETAEAAAALAQEIAPAAVIGLVGFTFKK